MEMDEEDDDLHDIDEEIMKDNDLAASKGVKRKLERDIELEQGDDYILDLKKNYDLPESERYDIIPELWNGHNIADFVDKDIEAKLAALEAEEEERIRTGYYDLNLDSEDDELVEIRDLAKKIRKRKGIMKFEARYQRTNKPKLSRPAKTVSKSFLMFSFMIDQLLRQNDDTPILPKHFY